MTKTLDEAEEEKLCKDLYYLHVNDSDNDEDESFEIRQPPIETEIEEVENPIVEICQPEKKKQCYFAIFH